MNLHAREAGLLAGGGGNPEAFDHVLDLRNGERYRLAELPARQAQWDGRWRLGMRIDHFLGLATGMAELGPAWVAFARRRFRPAAQGGAQLLIRGTIDNHIPWPLQVVAVDLDVAG
jgi:hypothetical protein